MTLHANSAGTGAEHRIGWHVNAVIAVADDASGKRLFLESFAVRTLCVHLGLKGVTVGTHILNLVDSWRRRAMVSMTGGTGWRTQIAPHRQRVVVHARAVLCELIRGNGVSLHVSRVGVAARAGVGHVDRVHGGTGIAGRPEIVDAMTIRAYGNLRVSSREALAVHAGVVLVQLVCAQAGVVLPHQMPDSNGKNRTTAESACDQSCPSNPPCGSWKRQDRSWLRRLRGNWHKSIPFVRGCPG